MATTIADIRTSAGSKLSVTAEQPVTYDAAGFEALTFTEVAWVSNLGEFGKTYNLVTFNPLATRQTIKRKGSYENGSMSLELARVTADPGQQILIDARDSDLSFSYCVEIQDGTKFYFSAQCMSYTANVGSVDDITMSSVSLEIDNEVIEVAAVDVPVTSVELTPSTSSVAEGATVNLTASVLPPEADQSVTFASSDPAIATVSASGVVTGVAEGVATITVTSVADNTKTDTSTITVTA